MPYLKDPHGRQYVVLHRLVDFAEKTVLEVGCGQGKLTWHYAQKAAQVTAIDPKAEAIAIAQADTPETLKGQVTFVAADIADFTPTPADRKFDLALYGWSL